MFDPLATIHANPKACRQIERALEMGQVVELRPGIYHILRPVRFEAASFYVRSVVQ